MTVLAPDQLKELDFDKVIICNFGSADDIKAKLTGELGIPESKVDMSGQEIIRFLRERFVTDFAKIVYDDNIQGAVAEGGVYKGDFAAHISRCFPDRRIWLFDTFEGFDERDVNADVKQGFSSGTDGVFLKYPFIDKVVNKQANPENTVIKKGFFPETTVGDERLAEEQFVFVNLDFDLYEPILAGLRFFYPKMARGGIILVHDFFHEFFSGAQKAAREFCDERNIRFTPIGDGFSVAITKQ
jgi:hypothetical protein